ncbi:sterol desaturase family protein [Gloeobacter violaceus]|uniref:Gll3710 protein n=1 Tax=Gloeobacter violaceus (strain ATCC 29082 / PCC 7421) TaxID=251221 RepID=Q7NF17_GLOVI|nr:sterol desaturase family protein [Gloeobacter violaceus]BAC91651.1 gll3710 [Gloeobacter violaceus PCC 7421]
MNPLARVLPFLPPEFAEAIHWLGWATDHFFPLKMAALLALPLAIASAILVLQVHVARTHSWPKIWADLRQAHQLTPSFRVELGLMALGMVGIVGWATALGDQGRRVTQGAVAQFLHQFYPEQWTLAALGHRSFGGTLLALVFYIALFDLILYASHRIKHSRLLWDLHKIHHSPTSFNLVFAVYNRDRSIIPTYALLDWIPFALLLPLGTPVGEATIYFAIYKVLDKARNIWIHMPFYTSFGWLDYLFVSPAVHQCHHGADTIYHGKNFGSLLSVWDVLFGTYAKPPAEPPALGIGEDGERLHRNLFAFLWLPIHDLGRTWMRTAGSLLPARRPPPKMAAPVLPVPSKEPSLK